MGSDPDWSGIQDPAAAGNRHTEADIDANTSGSQTYNNRPGRDTNGHNAGGHWREAADDGRKASGDDRRETSDNEYR